MVDVNYVLISFEANISPGDGTDPRLCVQSTNQIHKETDELHI